MSQLILQLTLAALGGIVAGAVAAWFTRDRLATREMETAESNWQPKLEKAVAKARASEGQAATLKVSLDNTERLVLQNRHSVAKAGTEIESLKDQIGSLEEALSNVRAERDEYATRATEQQRFVLAAKKKITDMTGELAKSRNFYREQLANSLEQRRALERKVESLKSEQASLDSLLDSAKAE